MKKLFFAVNTFGELIATSFDHESLILNCFKAGWLNIVIFYHSGSNLNYEIVNTALRLCLSASHEFRTYEKYMLFFNRPFECKKHSEMKIKRQFDEGFFKFCRECGKEL